MQVASVSDNLTNELNAKLCHFLDSAVHTSLKALRYDKIHDSANQSKKADCDIPRQRLGVQSKMRPSSKVKKGERSSMSLLRLQLRCILKYNTPHCMILQEVTHLHDAQQHLSQGGCGLGAAGSLVDC